MVGHHFRGGCRLAYFTRVGPGWLHGGWSMGSRSTGSSTSPNPGSGMRPPVPSSLYKVLRDARERVMMMRSRAVLDDKPVSVRILDAVLACIKKMYNRVHRTAREHQLGPHRRRAVPPGLAPHDHRTRRTRLQRIMAQCDPAPFAAYSDCLYFALSEHQQVTGLKIVPTLEHSRSTGPNATMETCAPLSKPGNSTSS